MRGWIFLQAEVAGLGENGNYSDIRSERYQWDSTVPNGHLPKSGDLVVLRGSKNVFGVSFIESLEVENGYKVRLRCQKCHSTKLRFSRKQDSFQCSKCGESSASPNPEFVGGITQSVAYFGTLYSDASHIPLSDLRVASMSPKSQHSIQELDLEKLLPLIGSETLSKLGVISLGSGLGLKERVSGLRLETLGSLESENRMVVSDSDQIGELLGCNIFTYDRIAKKLVFSAKVNVSANLAAKILKGRKFNQLRVMDPGSSISRLTPEEVTGWAEWLG